MPQANGIQTNLICDGTPLIEYPSPSSEDPNMVLCESTPGQTFEVNFTGPGEPSDCVVELYCDGVYMDGYVYPQSRLMKSTFYGIYLPNDDATLLPFKFANVELCEEDDSHSEQIVKNLGTVSLEFVRCTLGPTVPRSESVIPSVASNSKFSERNKKASMIPHTIGLGESIPASTKKSSTCRIIYNKDPTPYLRFVWQYRSRSMLITSGVISRPVSPLRDIPQPVSPRITHQNDELRSVQGQKPRVEASKDLKPDIKPKLSGSKPLVIDLCDETQTSTLFSNSIDNPIILDDDEDDDLPIESSKNAQASSSSNQKGDIKPVKIESKMAAGGQPDQSIIATDGQSDQSIIASHGQPSQTKRTQAGIDVEESDPKRAKLSTQSVTLNGSDEDTDDEAT